MFFKKKNENQLTNKEQALLNDVLIAQCGYLEAENSAFKERAKDIIEQNVEYEIENLEFEEQLDEFEETINDIDEKVDDIEERLDSLEDEISTYLSRLDADYNDILNSNHKKNNVCNELKFKLNKLKKLRNESYLKIKMKNNGI